ncbi:hypothetical protein DPMN_126079 [Dreissena polymorpha]|uniref:Uncharacterized protein n=1 Tax=Dreissena polymorpha TaxID=45954 RepID=A0A9D4GZD6_DREPO|nr:hypothetical protein DPMN_126079 [Dreissena polymorpha]
MRKMPSANLKLEMGFPPVDIELWWSWRVTCIIFSRKKVEQDKREQACLTEAQ